MLGILFKGLFLSSFKVLIAAISLFQLEVSRLEVEGPNLLNGYAVLDKKARYAVANGSGYAVSGSIPDQMEFREEVDEALPDVRVTAIDHLWLNHNLILLHVSNSDFGPTPFKLFYSCEEKIEAGYANDNGRDSRNKLLQALDRLDTFESFDLFQKVRVKWDIKGDENSKFFHRLIKQKRRAQMISVS
ncbi:hypothetical protein Tco_0313362 [Tanacetum coccineum]